MLVAIGQARLSEAQIAVAEGSYYPTVTGSLSGSFGGSSQPYLGIDANGGPVSDQLSSVQAGFNAGVTARWTIWDFGRTSLAVEAARRSAAVARLDVHTSERNAVAAVAASAVLHNPLADEQLGSRASRDPAPETA